MKSVIIASLLLTTLSAPAAIATEVFECAEGVCAGVLSFGSCDSMGGNVALVSILRPEGSATVSAGSVCSANTNGVGASAQYFTPAGAGIANVVWIESYDTCITGAFAILQVPFVGLVPVVHNQGCPAPPPAVPVLLP